MSAMLCSANYWQVQTEGDTIKAKKGLQIKYGRPAWDLVLNDCDQIDLNWQKLEKTRRRKKFGKTLKCFPKIQIFFKTPKVMWSEMLWRNLVDHF